MCLHYRPNFSKKEYVKCLCLTLLKSLHSLFISYNSQVHVVRNDEDPVDEKLILNVQIGATVT